jgi:hypothetical protein
MKRNLLLWVPTLLCLCGCSLSTAIDTDIGDYYRTAAIANDRLVLLNIPRAAALSPVEPYG